MKYVIAALLLAAVGIAVAVNALPSRENKGPISKPQTPGDRLLVISKQRDDYRISVGVPLLAPRSWATVTDVDEETIDVENHGKLRLRDVSAFFATYPSGDILYEEAGALPLPDGLTGLKPAAVAVNDELRDEDLLAGRKRLRIAFAPSKLHPRDSDHYSTTLTNMELNERIKVLRFGGYHKSNGVWKLSTVTKDFYSAEEFREWYGLGKEEWVIAGQSVTDPNNYGGRPCLWAYYCEMESGEKFVAGGVLD